MNMSTVIKIENLSKKYIIGHQKQEKYTTLRDSIMHKLRGLGQKLHHPLSPNKEETSLEEFWALKDIDLEIKQGDRVGIIGRNGAGKSTLLKVLSRITEPTTGRISIKGRVASLLEVGTGFHPELTGRENIFLNGAILGMSRADIKNNFEEIVAFAEVEKFLDTPVKRYSSGMYVRLAFAVAAHLEPEILVVDEVLAVGDASFQKKCLGKMDEVGSEGRTIIFVSHNMAAVQKLCGRAILLEKGENKKVGGVDEVINEYISRLYENLMHDDLFSRQRANSFGQEIRITRCRLYNSKNKETKSFRFGELFFVEVECSATTSLRNLQFVVGLNSAQDQRIATIMSYGGQKAFNMESGDKKRGILKVNLCLNPGKYSITLGVRNEFNGYDQLQNIRFFHVDSARYKNIENDPYVHYGLVHLPNPDWTIS